MTDTRRAFAEAAFAAYGLDEGWTGLRFFGGWGASNGSVNRLELAHGDNPFDDTPAQVRVETLVLEDTPSSTPASLLLWLSARSLVEHLWRETGELRDDVRRAVFTADRVDADPTGPWDSAQLLVDDEPVAFRYLTAGDSWVALATRGETVLAIQAKQWQIDETGLATVRDLDPYERGSIALAMRPPPPP